MSGSARRRVDEDPRGAAAALTGRPRRAADRRQILSQTLNVAGVFDLDRLTRLVAIEQLMLV